MADIIEQHMVELIIIITATLSLSIGVMFVKHIHASCITLVAGHLQKKETLI